MLLQLSFLTVPDLSQTPLSKVLYNLILLKLGVCTMGRAWQASLAQQPAVNPTVSPNVSEWLCLPHPSHTVPSHDAGPLAFRLEEQTLVTEHSPAAIGPSAPLQL